MSFQAKYLVPNSVTTVAMLMGLASIATSATGDDELAAWMILWAALLDRLDGVTARLMKATSKFGSELDSFADFVSFGLAPAALVFVSQQQVAWWQGRMHWVLVVCCAGYVVASAMRLARFNVAKPPRGETHFYGVPTTHCAAIIAPLYLTLVRHEAVGESVGVMPLVLVAMALMMVSNILLPKIRRHQTRLQNGLQATAAISLYIVVPLRLFPEYVLFISVTMLVVGFIVGLRDRRDKPTSPE